MILTKEQLKTDLHIAYKKAIKHKKKKPYVKEFTKNLDSNINLLLDDLWNRTYVPEPSICFIISHPKKREVFAASFRDRIVHHLYYMYTSEFFERTFINDSYSCIKKRGSKYGIERLKHHIELETNFYTEEAYVLKIDIKGYFMNIDRYILLDIALRTINRYSKLKEFNEKLDFEFIKWLTKEIILLDCTKNCIYISKKEEYIGLPKSKMLSSTPPHCGLPIGNLTSQLFSNVYLNLLDQYIKRVLKFKHYGRYVDDAYIVSADRQKLLKSIPLIEEFLNKTLHLKLQKGKTKISKASYGVEFLGAYIKPYRIYVSNQCLRRMKKTIFNKYDDKEKKIQSKISKIGYLLQYKSYNIRKKLFFSK